MKLLPWFRHTVDTSFDVCCKIAAVAKFRAKQEQIQEVRWETATQLERALQSIGRLSFPDPPNAEFLYRPYILGS